MSVVFGGLLEDGLEALNGYDRPLAVNFSHLENAHPRKYLAHRTDLL